MGPEWWIEAFDLAEAEVGPEAWAALSDAERDEAVAEVLRGRADQLRAEAVEADLGEVAEVVERVEGEVSDG